ncbi:MAG: DUF362 domain-containing protein [Faecalibacterium sp.]
MPNTVYRALVSDYDPAAVDAAVEALFAALPIAATISANTKLLLKPNLLAKHPAAHAVTTHPEVLRAVIRACKRRGALPAHITVADSAGGLYNPVLMKQLYQGCGLAEVCAAEGVLAYTECKSVVVPAVTPHVAQEFELLTPVVEADFIINLPKLKTHVMTGLTAATKNLFGTIPGLKKAEWHTRFPDKPRFGDMLIDLYQTVTPQINLLDAIIGMEGDGPAGGAPRTAGQLLASADTLNLDLAAAHLIGLAPMRVPYLAAAHARGLCADAFDPATLAGEVAGFAPLQGWKLPESYLSERASVDFSNHAPRFLRPAAKKLLDAMAPRPVVRHADCIGCGKCAEICPQDTIILKDKKATIQKSNCIRCFCCHEMCPVKAIAVKKFRAFGL